MSLASERSFDNAAAGEELAGGGDGLRAVAETQQQIAADVARLLDLFVDFRDEVLQRLQAAAASPPVPSRATFAEKARTPRRTVTQFEVDVFSMNRMSKASRMEDRPTDHSSGTRSVAIGLPASWPACIRARDLECAGLDVKAFEDYGLVRSVHRGQEEEPTKSDDDLPDSTSQAYAVWAVLGVAVLLHDFSVIPYALAWQIPFAGFLRASSIFSLCWWAADIAATVAHGASWSASRGLRLAGAARRYVRTFMVLDLTLISTDMLVLIVEAVASREASGSARVVRVAKIIRLLRIAGFLRALRIVNSVHDLFEEAMSENTRALLTVCSLATAFVWGTHVVACSWFAIGNFAQTDTGQHWLDTPLVYDGQMVSYREVSDLYQYLTALQWAVQQLALAGTIDTTACNACERVFNMIWLIIGLVFGSALVSTLSATMVGIRSRQQDRDQKIRALRRYLLMHGVQHSVGVRVLRHASQRLLARANAAEATVPALELLSTGLRVELHANICQPGLLPHPLFRLWACMDHTWFLRFCTEVVRLTLLREADELFRPGVPAEGAFVVLQGTVTYTQTPTSSLVLEESSCEVVAGAWICEAALWCEWIHVGTATCTSICKLLHLEAERFSEVCRSNHRIGAVAMEYCRQYLRRVAAARPPRATWPSDLAVPHTGFEDLVSTMPRPIRQSIGVQAIWSYTLNVHDAVSIRERRRKAGSGNGTEDGLTPWQAELMVEVKQGTSVVVMDGAGRLSRVVALTAVHIEDEDGHIFVELGKWDGTAVKAACDLPASKCKDEEVAQAALERMLSTKLAPMADKLDVGRAVFSVTERTSRQFKVRTKYLRTVWFATLHGACDLPVCISSLHLRTLTSSSAPFKKRKPPRFPHMTVSDSQEGVYSLPDTLLLGPVYYLGAQSKGTFHAWLDPRDFELIQKPAYKAALEAWLAMMDLPVAIREADMMSTEGDADGLLQPHWAEGHVQDGRTMSI